MTVLPRTVTESRRALAGRSHRAERGDPPYREAVTFTYAEVGATAGELPAGYVHVSRSLVLGHGEAAFAAAGEALLTWRMQRDAGIRIAGSTPRVAVGVRVVQRIGPLAAPCEVVWVVETPRRVGYAYGSLPGHPVGGEEAFVVRRDDGDTVVAEITSFSRPRRWFTRLAGPLVPVVQRIAVGRYLAALRRAARADPT